MIRLHHISNYSGLIKPKDRNIIVHSGFIISLIQPIPKKVHDFASRTKLPRGPQVGKTWSRTK